MLGTIDTAYQHIDAAKVYMGGYSTADEGNITIKTDASPTFGKGLAIQEFERIAQEFFRPETPRSSFSFRGSCPSDEEVLTDHPGSEL